VTQTNKPQKSIATGRRRWRPRQGRPLVDTRGPGTIELRAASIVSKVPKLLYGPVALGVGVLVAFSGREELQLHCYGVLFVAIWLAFDLWVWLLGNGTKWRFAVGWTLSNLLLIAWMAFVGWSISTKRS